MNEETYKLHRRFDHQAGGDGDSRLFNSRVTVVGLGGVGSFAAEALARSGIGHLTLVDFDLVCVTNANRQIQAMRGNVGKPKANVLAERLRQIILGIHQAVPLFYEARLADKLLPPDTDFVVDASDHVTAKCHLLATCRERNIPVVCSTGASGRFDPTRIEVADLADTKVDPLGKMVRKLLRRDYGFPRKGPFEIPAVFSTEPLSDPVDLHYDGGNGFSCVCPNGENDVHTCEDRNVIWGTAGFVTGSFGLAAASVVVRKLVQPERAES